MKSYVAKPCDVNRKWYVVDAKDVVLGRLAAEVASILRGKRNVRFQPSFDMGDYVIVVNAEKVIELAVKGMLPKNVLGRQMFKKLKVYAGPEHNHEAQQPEVLTLSK